MPEVINEHPDLYVPPHDYDGPPEEEYMMSYMVEYINHWPALGHVFFPNLVKLDEKPKDNIR